MQPLPRCRRPTLGAWPSSIRPGPRPRGGISRRSSSRSGPTPTRLEAARERLRTVPPLVFAGEARQVQAALAEVAAGRAFLLQAGDCAESFHDFTRLTESGASFSAVSIRERLKILLQMAAVLTYGAALPVLKVGRIAGQFVKPRSSSFELTPDGEIPVFRGHMVHDDAPTAAARRPDPERMIEGYHMSASTLNLVRAFTKGGLADLSQVHTWNQQFVAELAAGTALRRPRLRDRAGARLHGRLRDRPRRDAAAASGRRLDEPRGAAARLRGGPHPPRLVHGRLVRLLRAHALDRRAHAPTRRRPRRVLLRRPQPARAQARPRGRRPTRWSSSASGSIRTASRAA